MSLNKWLCEHMDFGDKGYVTIGDVANGAFYISIFTGVVAAGGIVTGYMYFHGAALFIQSDIPYGDLILGDDGACVVMFAFINVIAILVVAAIVARKLASIRVATCEQKEED